MTERLGFNDTLLLLAVAGIGAFALGALLGTSSTSPGITGYIEQTDEGSRDAVRNLQVTGNILQDLGVVAAGTAVILAAVRAEGHSTAIRAIMLILGVVIIFQMLNFGFSAGFGR